MALVLPLGVPALCRVLSLSRPGGVARRGLRERIEVVTELLVSDRFDRLLELVEEYELLQPQEESLRGLLGEEPGRGRGAYTEEARARRRVVPARLGAASGLGARIYVRVVAAYHRGWAGSCEPGA